MIDILIDAALFSIPPYAADEADVHSILLRAVRLNAVTLQDAPFRLYKLSSCEEVLGACGCWPMQDDVEFLLNESGLQDVFSLKDVIISFMTLLANAAVWAEDYVEVVECVNYTLNPDVMMGLGPAVLADHSRMVFATAALHEQTDGRQVPVISGIAKEVSDLLQLTATATQFCGNSVPQGPQSVIGSILLIDGVEDLAMRSKGLAVWNSARDSGDLYFSIAVECLKILLESGAPVKLAELQQFAIGSEFAGSLAKLQAGPGQPHALQVLKACARVVLGIPKYEIKPMGKPNQTIRQIDGARALRTHLWKGHEAGRLMLWQSGEIYELANVGPKNEVVIERGTSIDRYTYSWA